LPAVLCPGPYLEAKAFTTRAASRIQNNFADHSWKKAGEEGKCGAELSSEPGRTPRSDLTILLTTAARMRAVKRVKFKLHDKRAMPVDLGRHLGMPGRICWRANFRYYDSRRNGGAIETTIEFRLRPYGRLRPQARLASSAGPGFFALFTKSY